MKQRKFKGKTIRFFPSAKNERIKKGIELLNAVNGKDAVKNVLLSAHYLKGNTHIRRYAKAIKNRRNSKVIRVTTKK